ncbi:unnamed protein product [Linum trigynum]|uniref:Uncharacterized protein n=1 Tax=Linum trigynum TaxID=586398 RepID=A0AAV2DP13_9ROSI
MHAKTDSEVTSLAPSSPTRSPRRPAYFVQSPSRDSHDGGKTTTSFHSTPVLSPVAPPPTPAEPRERIEGGGENRERDSLGLGRRIEGVGSWLFDFPSRGRRE